MDDSPEQAQPPILNYADATTGKLCLIARFPDEAEARMAASKLESEDIAAMVSDRTPAHGIGRRSAWLAVTFDDTPRAVEILMQTPARRFILEEFVNGA